MGWLSVILLATILLSACQGAANSSTIATNDPILQPTLTIQPTHSQPPAPQPSAEPQTPAPIATLPAPTASFTATAAGATFLAGKVVMPILLYHRVSEEGSAQYRVTPQVFREQMEWLKKEGYQAVTVSQVADVIRGGGTLPQKPVAITFDDGYLDTYENAFPILSELGFTATVYIITGTLGTDKSYGYMQEDALTELIAAGWEIGSHSVTHTSLKKTKLGAGNEMRQSKVDLEKKLGIKVRSFSYPYGEANQEIKDLAAQMGYESGVGIDILNTHTTRQLYFLTRREVYSSMTMTGFANLLIPGTQDNLLATQDAVRSQTPQP